GALDGGLDIPHSEKSFVGFSKDNKSLDADVHRKYIYGGHVAAYMKAFIKDESTITFPNTSGLGFSQITWKSFIR
ncbi:60S ribosomal protein L5, partial [Tanacetum coccineum]